MVFPRVLQSPPLPQTRAWWVPRGGAPGPHTGVLAWILIPSSLVCATGCRCNDDAGRATASEAFASDDEDTGSGVTRYIAIDQFGYRPDEFPKVAVLVDPMLGWNAKHSYTPGPRIEVRSASDDRVVLSGKPSAWKGGAVDPISGDRGFWFDFSELRTPGSYYVYDPRHRLRSYGFEVGANVYRNVLRAALRMFYFNRANVEKRAPYACVHEKCWTLGADHVGPGQDREARSVGARDDPSTARDLSGGWWDAGDTNKYVTFAHTPVHQLLTAYSERPAPFTDDFGLPESGNGLPDLIDEVKVEIDWLEKMQPADLGGGVLLKLGDVQYSNALPDRSKAPRYYYPGACSSSTIAAAGMFAHAAYVFRDFARLKGYAADLTERAVRAFEHYQAHPKSTSCDDGTITGGNADRDLSIQSQQAVVAAVYLSAVTGEARYARFVAQHYRSTRPFQEDRWSSYDPEQGDALLFYTTLSNADSDAQRAILERKRSQGASVELYGFRADLDPYRAYLRRDSFHWGSNQVRANVANTNYDLLQFGLAPKTRFASLRERVAGLLHYFHGVNPMQLVYLSNMRLYGAERSVNEIFHAWFRDGDEKWDSARSSSLGPAPGYLVGGPNARYCREQSAARHRCARSELSRQPPGKAYLDFNTGWRPESEHDKSWEVSEPAIYYQSAYVKLVSKFVD